MGSWQLRKCTLNDSISVSSQFPQTCTRKYMRYTQESYRQMFLMLETTSNVHKWGNGKTNWSFHIWRKFTYNLIYIICIEKRSHLICRKHSHTYTYLYQKWKNLDRKNTYQIYESNLRRRMDLGRGQSYL